MTTDGDVMMNSGDDNIPVDRTIQNDLTGHLTGSVAGAEDLTGRYAMEIPSQFPLRLRCVAGKLFVLSYLPYF